MAIEIVDFPIKSGDFRGAAGCGAEAQRSACGGGDGGGFSGGKTCTMWFNGIWMGFHGIYGDLMGCFSDLMGY